MDNTVKDQRSTRVIDIIAISASLVIIGLAAAWLINTSPLYRNFADDPKLSWHLIRATGITAYGLLVASMVWGLLVSSQYARDWSPGVLSTTLHSTLSWLAVMLSLIHALLLMADKYFSYSLSDILVPFTGPYRPLFVGLGTLAFWFLTVIAVTFPIKRRIGQRLWKLIHYVSYLAFAMVTVHGLTAGTDAAHAALRILMGAGVIVVILLFGIRLGRDQRTSDTKVKEASRSARRSPAERSPSGSTTSNRAP